MTRQIICLDFDGVCNTYIGWRGENELFEPRPGLIEFIMDLVKTGYRVAIFSTRPATKLNNWFFKYFPSISESLIVKEESLFFPDKKPPALVYIDDRAIRFNGNFTEILPQILSFKAHWE